MNELVDKESKWVYENYAKNLDILASKLSEFHLLSAMEWGGEDPYSIQRNNFEWFNYYHRSMFIHAEKIDHDLKIFSKLLNNRENVLYGDHTIAYRLINLSKIYSALSLENKLIADWVLDLDFRILNDQSFSIMSKGYNHAVDQLFGIICYHHFVKQIDLQVYARVLSDLKLEITNSIDECYIHVENTPDYHYYAMQRLSAINAVINDSEFSTLLAHMTEYLSYVVPYEGAQLINFGDCSGKYIWGDLPNPVLKPEHRDEIKWFKTGHLIYCPENTYFIANHQSGTGIIIITIIPPMFSGLAARTL